MKQFNTEHINSIRSDLRTWFGNDWAKSFDESKDKARWFRDNQDALLTNDQFIRKYDIDALQGVDSKAMESIYNRYPDYSKLTENQIKRFEATSNQSREELQKYYKFREDQRKEVKKFNDERYKELETARQESERAKDKSYFTGPFANEYARKAYIQGNKDLAGKQEFLGKTAAVSDFMPFPVSLMGPAIRTSQKHGAGEDVWNLGTAADFAGAVIPDIVEKPAKLAWQFLKQQRGLGKALESPWARQIEARIKKADNKAAEEAAHDIKLTEGLDVDNLTDEQLLNLYNEVKTPEIKKSVEDYWNAKRSMDVARETEGTAAQIADAAEVLSGAERKRALQAADIAAAKAAMERETAEQALTTAERKANYNAMMNKPTLEVRSGNLPKDNPILGVGGDFNTYYKDVPLKDIIDYNESQIEPSKLNDALYQLLMLGGRKASRATIGGHKWNEIDYKPNYSEDKAISDIINMYSDDWKYGRPANYDEPLIKAAYDKWLKDQYRKGNYDVLYRLGEIK